MTNGNPFDPGYYTSDQLRQFGFARVGEGCAVARNCTILGLENITLGDHVRIDGYTSLIATRGPLRIGSRVHICSGCMIGSRGGVELEDFSSLSHGVRLISATDDYSGNSMTNSTLPNGALGVTAAPIRIGRHAPVGAGALLLPGAELGEGTAVLPMSVVAGRCPHGRSAAATPPSRCGRARGTCSSMRGGSKATAPEGGARIRLHIEHGDRGS